MKVPEPCEASLGADGALARLKTAMEGATLRGSKKGEQQWM